MSDPRYAPYGADDDPFLTHPAGPGQGYSGAQSAGHWQAKPGQNVAHSQHARSPRTGGHAPAAAEFSPARAMPQQMPPASYADDRRAYLAPEAAEYTRSYPAQYAHSHGQDHLAADYAPPPMAAQRGNFRPSPKAGFAPAAAGHPAAHGPQSGYDDPAYGTARPAPDPWQKASGWVQQHANPRSPAPVAQPGQSYDRPAYDGVAYDSVDREQARYAEAVHSGLPPRHSQPQSVEDRLSGAWREGFAANIPVAGQLMQWAGAICTILALLGAGYWGYSLALRDANGIPVVRATLGPLRIAPEQPGGEISAHQGLAVNAIPATGSSAPLSETITLAPQTATLAPEDTLVVEQGSFAPLQTAGGGTDAALAGASDSVLALPQTSLGISADLSALPESLPEDMPLTDAEAVERALAAALAEGGEFVDQPAPAPMAQALQGTNAAPSEPASMSNTNPLAPPTAELDPATIPLGTPMVQLGAFDTAETARAEWANLQTRFTELMAGKALVVEQAKSGGRDFFRLRAHGFDSVDDTRRFCSAIMAENGTCLTVDQR